ncbi:MAG: RNA polymerase sigma factor [Verrucomicrobiales bacterium]|nr:RNA polymerase sigma factor [Verrucomicrobiales bacterium]
MHSTPDLPDSELPVGDARGGDPRAWDVLVRRYQAPLFAYIEDLVRDRATSLDLVQDTLIRAIRYLPGLRDDRRFGSWLFGIAHQRVLLHWRRRGRSPFADTPLPEKAECAEESPDLSLIRTEEAAGLLAAIDDLPPAQRSVVLLHFLENFALADIAEITGTSLGTVKSRLHYAKHALRRSLQAAASPTSHEDKIPT